MKLDFVGRHRVIQRGAVLLWIVLMSMAARWFFGLEDPTSEQLGGLTLIAGLSGAGVYRIYVWEPSGKCGRDDKP